MKTGELDTRLDDLYTTFKGESIKGLENSVNKIGHMLTEMFKRLSAGETYTQKDKKGVEKHFEKPRDAFLAHLKDSIGYMFFEADRSEAVCGLFIGYCLHTGMKKEDITEYLNNTDSQRVIDLFEERKQGFKDWMFNPNKEEQLRIAKDVYTSYLMTAMDEMDSLKKDYKKSVTEFLENHCIYVCSGSTFGQTLFLGDLSETEVYKIAEHVDKKFEEIGVQDGFEKARTVILTYHTAHANALSMVKRYEQTQLSSGQVADFCYMQQRILNNQIMSKWGENGRAFNTTVTVGEHGKGRVINENAAMAYMQYVYKKEENEEMLRQIKLGYFRDFSNERLAELVSNNDRSKKDETGKVIKVVKNSKEYNAVLQSLVDVVMLENKHESEAVINAKRKELIEKCTHYLKSRNPSSEQGKDRYALVCFVSQVNTVKMSEANLNKNVEVPKGKFNTVKNMYQLKLLYAKMKDVIQETKNANQEGKEFDLKRSIAKLYVYRERADAIELDPKVNSAEMDSFDKRVEAIMEMDAFKKYCASYDIKRFDKVNEEKAISRQIVNGVNAEIRKQAEAAKQNETTKQTEANKSDNTVEANQAFFAK